MSIHVTDSDFKSAVLEASKSTPVVVDFWAEWCGPCRMIGPILEKLEEKYAGRFILAKLDTDRNQYTASRFKISSIPAVKIFIDGEVAHEFVGALPETSIVTILDGILPDARSSELADLAEKDPVEAAREVLSDDMKGKKAEEILWKGIVTLLSSGSAEATEEVRKFLHAIPQIGSSHSDLRRYLLSFLEDSPGEEDLAHLTLIFRAGRESEGLDYFLERVRQTSGEEREREKTRLITCFFLLGNGSTLVNDYRRKLSSILF